MSWVIDHSKSKANSFVVLLLIANHAHSDGTGAWPSLITLAKECRISRRTVWSCIENLEISGELIVKRARGRKHVNHYELPFVKKVQELHHLKGANAEIKGANMAFKRCKAIAPEPSLNRPLNQPSSTAQPQRAHTSEQIRQIEAKEKRQRDEQEVAKECRVGTGPVCLDSDLRGAIAGLATRKSF